MLADFEVPIVIVGFGHSPTTSSLAWALSRPAPLSEISKSSFAKMAARARSKRLWRRSRKRAAHARATSNSIEPASDDFVRARGFDSRGADAGHHRSRPGTI